MSSDDRRRRGRKERSADALSQHTGPKEPVGIDRARRSQGAPPRRPRRDADTRGTAPPRPDLPAGAEIDLPKGVRREIERQAKDADGVAKALTLGSAAVQDGDAEGALGYLEWAKWAAPRAPSVREALGIARYLAEDWAGALSELQTYRRLTGRHDQDHLIGDCLRAQGRPASRVAEAVAEVDPDRDGEDRYAEAMIVWASALADAGDPDAGRSVLRRALDRAGSTPEPQEHEVRLWYVAGDLAQREGDRDEARRWFERVAAVDEDLYDVTERLAAL